MRAYLFPPILFLLAALTPAWSQIVIPDPPRPRPLPQPVAPLQIRSIHVDVTVEDGMALTSMEQVFFNPGGRMAEGSYLFPLPAGAAVESFTMMIDGKEMPAELLDAKKARGIYTEIVRRMKDPALLEYMGGGLFRARVFPIEARSEKVIKLRYRHVLDQDQGLARYRYPLRSARLAAARIGTFTFSAEVHAKPSIQTLYSPTHELVTDRISAGKAKLSLEKRNFQPERDLEMLISSGNNPVGMRALTHGRGAERYFWLAITPALENKLTVSKDIAFVIDTSGSMAGEKLEQAKKALRFCIANLEATDRLAIIRFSTETESMSTRWITADRAGKRQAESFVNDLQAMGGTNLGEAVATAFALTKDPARAQAVVLLTDGKPTIGETREDAILGKANAEDPRRVFSFGIGEDINIRLLDRLAEQSGGWRTYARPDGEIELELSSLFTKISAPVLAAPKLTVSGVKISEIAPSRLPDLFKGTTLHVFGRYDGVGRAKIRLEGITEGRQREFTYTFRFPKAEPDNTFIPALWAQRQVGYLLDQIRLNGESKELVDEVVRLAKRHGIITPYTSYLILEDDARLNASNDAAVPELESQPVLRNVPLSIDEAREEFRDLKADSGYAGISASKKVQEMATSEQLAKPERMVVSGKQEPPGRVYAAGRAFYRSGGFWTENLWLEERSEPERVTFGSDAYFELLTKHPELAPVLALGNKVRFVHAERRYEVAP